MDRKWCLCKGISPKLFFNISTYFIFLLCMQGLLPSIASRMSLKEGTMAAHSIDVHHGEASSSSSPQGISFVKSIDRKARSYLKTLERSFTFSLNESKGDDSSTMTIEFLRARLQAQRAEYKAEKQRSQLLAKKVLELEQRLSFEVRQRRKAECSNMQLIAPNYRSSSLNRLKDTRFSSKRGFAFINSKLKGISSGEEDPTDCYSGICGREVHPDGNGLFLISPSPLQHCWESMRHERRHMDHQHVSSQFNEAINAASGLDEESLALKYKELREMPYDATSCDECALSMEVLKSIADQESTKSCAITTDVKEESSAVSQYLSVSNIFDISAFGEVKPSETGHNVFRNNVRRQASASLNADKGCKSDGFLQCMHATQSTTHHPNNFLAGPSDSCRNYQPEFFQSPIKPLDRMVSFKSSFQKGVDVQDVHTSSEVKPEFGTAKGTNLPQISKSMCADHDRIHEYIVAHSNTMKEMQEERASRGVSNQEGQSKYAKESFSAEYLRQSSQKLHMQKTNATSSTRRSFSVMETRCGRKLHGHRMSLDGGLDRLHNVSKETCRALEDGETAKFPH